jgi:tripartite-type tricarboxylate transporter receptor subunit TctC
MPFISRRHLVAAAAAGPLFTPAIARAQGQTDWPNRPVRVIVPYAPGAGTDFIIRGVCERLARQTGQQFVVEHKGGAAGTLGAETVAKAVRDGYTLLFTPQAPIQLIPHLRKLSYDAMNDFTPIGRMGEAISGFACHPSVGATNLTEFVALAKKNPGKYTFATAGVGSVNHLRAETLKLMAGIDLLHVPYRGVGEALPDLLAGNVSTMFDTNVFAHVRAGKLNLLAILSDERYREFPDVKTVKEQGYPEYDVPVWYGAYAPAGLPAPMVEKMRAEIATIHTDKEFQEKQFSGGIMIYKEALSLAELKAKVETQSRFFGELIRRANIRLES